MKRRILAGLAATALAVGLLPASPAQAATVLATASLSSSDQAVYPMQPGETFSITVTNNEPVGTVGLIGRGQTINAIRVTFPVDQAGITLGDGAGSAGAGFTEAKPTNLGSTQYITYRAGSGRGLEPGQSTTITFPATVKRPHARDLTGAFRVHASTDNMGTSTGLTGPLSTKVQVLEIIDGSIKPVAPAGATDRSGTGAGFGYGGQTVDYEVGVRNHALSALPVTVSLTSSGPDTATSKSIPVNGETGTGTATLPLKLGLAESDRDATLTAAATATNAAAPTKTDTFTVQAPVRIPLSGLTPRRWRTGDGSARDFTVSAAKTGSPSVTALTGAMTFAGDNSCPVKDAPTFGGGSTTGSLTFACPDLKGTAPLAEVVPTGSGTLTDGNGAQYGFSSTLETLILDNVKPVLDAVVTLPTDSDGMQQIAVKHSGQRITVGGNVGNAGDLAGSNVQVTIDPDQGDDIVFTAPVSGSGETRTYSGSTTPTFDANATSFTVRVAVSDTSENKGEAEAAGAPIDSGVPTLANPGQILNSTTIQVQFNDPNKVAGGCYAGFWLIDGRPNVVTSVATPDGSDCNVLGDGKRLLTLSTPLGPDTTPTVTYDPALTRQSENLPGATKRYPAKDGASNDGLRQVINTLTDIVPLAPGIVRLERMDRTSGAYEPAHLDPDEGRYYTNADGEDGLRLTVNNVRSGYMIEVRQGSNVYTRRPPTPTESQLNGSSFDAEIVVPMPATQSMHEFQVLLMSTQGRYSDPTTFKVVLDKVAPTLASRVWSASSQTIAVTFAEKIVAGSDFVDNWLACETVDRETGLGESCIPPDSVTGGDKLTRTITVTTFEDPNRFKGLDYYLNSGTRYEDRAGNLMADTRTAV